MSVWVQRVMTERDSEPPTFPECVIGYRGWTIDERAQLRPVTKVSRPWKPGVNVAICKPSGAILGEVYPFPHQAPHESCRCGLYAFHDVPPIYGSYPRDYETQNVVPVVGAVAAFGRLEVHEDGFRAECAGVIALAVLPGMGPKAVSRVIAAAARYGVRVVNLDELPEEAARHGSALPLSARPETAPGEVRMTVALEFNSPGTISTRFYITRAPVPPAVARAERRTKRVMYAIAAAVGVACNVVIDSWWQATLASLLAGLLTGVVFARLGRRRRRKGTAAS